MSDDDRIDHADEARLLVNSLLQPDDPRFPVALAEAQVHATLAVAQHLDRIATWLETVQLVDPLDGIALDDDEPTNPEDWKPYVRPATAAENDRESAERLWREAKEGDRLRVYWSDGAESVWIAGAPETPLDLSAPLYPQVIRMVRA